MGTTVDHTYERKEEGCHKSVGEHLQDGTGDGSLVEHEDGEEHEAAVAHGGVGVDILQVGLHAGREGTIDHRNGSEDEEYPRQFVGSVRQEVHGNAEAAVASELHQHAGMEHRHRCGR